MGKPVVHPSAWTAADMRKRQREWVYQLSAEDVLVGDDNTMFSMSSTPPPAVARQVAGCPPQHLAWWVLQREP